MNLTNVQTWTIERGDDICTAMLMGSFTRHIYREVLDKEKNDGLYDRLDTSFDRLHGGCLFLSCAAMAVLEVVVDWDQWGEDGGGMLAYEHLEADLSKPYDQTMDLAGFLLREIPDEAWFDIAENHRVPTEDELKVLISKWCRAVKLPLLADQQDDDEDGESALAPLVLVTPAEPQRRCDSLPYDFEDFGMDIDELKAKYAAEQEHPEYTNVRWGREAPTTPYWDWVMTCIAQDDDETE